MCLDEGSGGSIDQPRQSSRLHQTGWVNDSRRNRFLVGREDVLQSLRFSLSSRNKHHLPAVVNSPKSQSDATTGRLRGVKYWYHISVPCVLEQLVAREETGCVAIRPQPQQHHVDGAVTEHMLQSVFI